MRYRIGDTIRFKDKITNKKGYVYSSVKSVSSYMTTFSIGFWNDSYICSCRLLLIEKKEEVFK